MKEIWQDSQKGKRWKEKLGPKEKEGKGKGRRDKPDVAHSVHSDIKLNREAIMDAIKTKGRFGDAGQTSGKQM